MTLSVVLIIVALVAAIVSEFTNRPHSVLSLAVVLLCLALLLGPVVRL